jgi:hypothetical protein
MQRNESGSIEASILTRVIQQDEASLPTAAARAMLAFHFPQSDLDRMHDLAVKNQEGHLTRRERGEMEAYRRIGRLLDLLSAKARSALRHRGTGA